MDDLQRLKERLVPLELGNEFDGRFANAFLVLYFSVSATFVFTRAMEVLGSELIAELNGIRRILDRRNLLHAYDLRRNFELMREAGLEFFSKHPNLGGAELRQISEALKADGPVIMLEFESQDRIETLFSKGGNWFKILEFKV